MRLSQTCQKMISSAKSLTGLQEVSEPSGKASLWVCTGAGPQMGFGHLRRTTILAQSLLDCCNPIFLIDACDIWSRERLADFGFNYCTHNLDQTWSVLPKPGAILIDTRETNRLDTLITSANNRKIPVVSIHDLGLNPLPSDILIDGSVAPRFEKSPRKAVFYSGVSYMVIDPEFRSFHDQKKEIQKKIKTVFINLGGGDSKNYFLKVMDGLKLWGRAVKVVGAPGFTSWGQENIEGKEWQPLDFHWEKGPISSVLFQADLAITAGGLSAYEALCVGTPLMALSYDDMQQRAIQSLSEAGVCISLGPGNILDPARLADQLSNIESNLEERKKISRRGRQLVDGLGACRVSKVIRDLILIQSFEF